MASITYNKCILIETCSPVLNNSKWDHYPSPLILHPSPLAWFQYSHSDYILYKTFKNVKTPMSIFQLLWHPSQMSIPTQPWCSLAFPSFGRGHKVTLSSQLPSLWLHPAVHPTPHSPWQQGKRRCPRHSWVLLLGCPACFSFQDWTLAPLLPEEGSQWMGSLCYCLLTETMLEMLNVQTRTFVLKIVHKALVPGIQRAQGFFQIQRQLDSFSLPQVCLDWEKCLIVLPLNGWFSVVI